VVFVNYRHRRCGEGSQHHSFSSELEIWVTCCLQGNALIEAVAGRLSAIVILRREGEQSLTLVDIMLRARSASSNRGADPLLSRNITSCAT
jgi:hypothetical protein